MISDCFLSITHFVHSVCVVVVHGCCCCYFKTHVCLISFASILEISEQEHFPSS